MQAGDTISLLVSCQAPIAVPALDRYGHAYEGDLTDHTDYDHAPGGECIDCQPTAYCDFGGWEDVTVDVNQDGEWVCPRCGASHTISNIDLHDFMGPDPDAAYERMRDARHE